MSLTPVMKCFELKQESFDISRDRHAKLISSKLTGIPFVKMSTSLANRICEIIAEKKMHFSSQTGCKRLETELSDNFRISVLSEGHEDALGHRMSVGCEIPHRS